MPYIPPASIENPTPGQVATAAWGDAVNAALDYLASLIDDSAPTSFTPQIDQGASTNIAKTLSYSKYKVIGKRAFWEARIQFTAAGTAGSALTIATLPVAIEANTSGRISFGYAIYFDQSTTIRYSCGIALGVSGQSKFHIIWGEDQTATNSWGADPNIAIASGDVLDLTASWFVS